MVNKKIKAEVYMSLFLLFETIIWFIIKLANIMNVEWWHILYTNMFTFIIYYCIFYNKQREKLIYPLLTMVVSLTTLGIISYLIPNFKELNIILKIWMFFLITLIIIPLYIYTNQSIKNKIDIKKIENSYKDVYKYEYYREIMNEYSPAVLSLIYNRKIKYSDALVATILDLKLKGYIDIEDKGIKVLNRETKNLLKNESLIYEKLEKNKNAKKVIYFKDVANIFSNTYFKKEWKSTIKMEAEEKKLCSSISVAFNILEKISIISFFALIIIPLLLFLILRKSDLDINNLVSYLIIVVIHSTLLCSTGILRKFNKINFFVRTQEGVDLQCKMSGLKNYIKDYSKLREKDLNDLILWEDYLIYTIIFDLKGNLDKEAEKLYKKLINI